MVSSKDVAKAANVSTSTVSRVFSNPDLVNNETKEKVLKIAKEINYVPNINARYLKVQKTNIIGVVISDINNPFYTHILERVLKNSVYQSYVVFSEENETKEIKNIYSLISTKAEAIIFTPIKYNNELENLIVDNQIPAIQLYRKAYESLDSLVIDDAYGTYLATKELLDNGHENIVLIDYELDIPTHREDGYIKAYNEYGIDYNHNNIIKINVNSLKKEDLFAILDSLNFTAMIPTSNIFSSLSLSYLKERGKKVKEDISLILYDDISYAEIMGLSVIAHPLNEIANVVKDIINYRLKKNKDDLPIHKIITPELIKRDSVKNLNDKGA